MTYECAIAIGAVTGTEALIKKAEEAKGGMINMCKAVSEALEESRALGMSIGIEQGRSEGILQGRNEGLLQGKKEGKEIERLQCIQKMMHNLKISANEAMTILDIPNNEQETIHKFLQK